MIKFAKNVAKVQTPINTDKYFFGAYLLTKEFPSGEKQISPIVRKIPNKKIHITLPFTEDGAPTPLVNSVITSIM